MSIRELSISIRELCNLFQDKLLSFLLLSSVIELESSLLELESSLIQLESSLFQIESS